jgi:hypothetical protein
MLSVYEVFLAAAMPIVKVVLIAVTGAFCATKRAGIITPEGVKSLSRIIVNLLVPCFLFTKLANALTIDKLGEWWLICGFGKAPPDPRQTATTGVPPPHRAASPVRAAPKPV